MQNELSMRRSDTVDLNVDEWDLSACLSLPRMVMKLHEYQAKDIFAEAGIPVPASQLAESVEEAVDAAEEIGYPVAIKAQVHVGGRGKAGGIKLVEAEDEAREAAEDILGMDLKGYHARRCSSRTPSTSTTSCTSA